MSLDNIEIDWTIIKGGAKTQWVKLTEKVSGIITGNGHKSAGNSSDCRGSKNDSDKEKADDTRKH